MYYVNTGAPFPRMGAEGWIDSHQVFKATAEEKLRLAYKLRPATEEEIASVTAAPASAPAVKAAPSADVPRSSKRRTEESRG